MSASPWMIYGANGYTGKLVAEEAVSRGHKPLLAGRSAEKLAPMAERLGLEWAAVSLEDTDALQKLVGKTGLVFHAAGPFVHTSRPMIEACLACGASYLDVTGEIPVFQHTFACDAAARKRGILLISGVGMDVIPTDCLSAYVAGKVPGAQQLEIALAGTSTLSPGTVKSALEFMPKGGLVRRNGELISLPLGSGAKRVGFSDRTRTVMPIPWGDLVTALHTTGISNITTYMAVSRRSARMAELAGPVMRRVLAVGLVRNLAKGAVGRVVKGPDERQRQAGRSYFWARAASEDQSVEAWLETVEGYQFTAVAGVRCVEKVLAGNVQGGRLSGALTPALAFGADFVLEIEGTRRSIPPTERQGSP